MKTRFITMAAIAAMICSTGCNKTVDNSEARTDGIPVKLTASIGDPATRLTFADTPNGLKASWDAVEKITVVTLDEDFNALAFDTFTSTGEAGRRTAEFEGTLSKVKGATCYDCWYPALEEFDSEYKQYRTPVMEDARYGAVTAQLYSSYVQYERGCYINGDNSLSHLPAHALMTGKVEGNPAEGLVTKMEHETSVVKVIAHLPDSAIGDCISSITIDGSNDFTTTRTWGYVSKRMTYNGKCIAPGGGPSDRLRVNFNVGHRDGLSGDLITSNTFTAYIGCILLRMQEGGTWTVTVTCWNSDNSAYEDYTATVTFPEEKVFDFGKLYTVEVNVEKE